MLKSEGCYVNHDQAFFVFDAQQRMAKKFDVCFMQESLPFTKYPALLELESHHEVDLGPSVPHARLSEGLYR